MMGKYMRHQTPKPSADVALGVKTRAKTLALKHKPDPSQAAGLSYLQLRSRRLFKPPVSAKKRTKRGIHQNAPNVQPIYKLVPNDVVNEQEEASFGDNCLDCDDDDDVRERGTRESTPCNLIRDPEIIRTPGSSTKPTCSAQAQRRAHNPILRHIPTTHDMDEFFSGAEVQQQQQFIEKYNFDPVNDVPLLGRYEWVKLEPKS